MDHILVIVSSNGCEFQSHRPNTQVCNHVNIDGAGGWGGGVGMYCVFFVFLCEDPSGVARRDTGEAQEDRLL